MKKSVLHVPPGKGTSWTIIGGDTITCKASAADTGGDCSVFETTTPPGCGSPPHVHRREDEIFYVLEGEFDFFVGSQTIRAGRGAFLIAPRDIPHRFANVGTAPGKLLITVTPPGIEKFFEELSRLPTDVPPSREQTAEFAGNYGIEFLDRV
jgi:quercetin dioxygenase-like cupin family protein